MGLHLCLERTVLCIGNCIFSRPIWLYKMMMKKLFEMLICFAAAIFSI